MLGFNFVFHARLRVGVLGPLPKALAQILEAKGISKTKDLAKGPRLLLG